MPDVMLSTEGLFENPEFDTRLTDWQRARQADMASSTAFYGALVDDYKAPNRSEDEVDELVSHIFEMAPDDLSESFNFDGLSEKAQRLSALRDQTALSKVEAMTSLVDFAKELGAHQFALFGLQGALHAGSDRPQSRITLMNGAKDTEQKLHVVDGLVRAHPGEVLTVAGYPSAIEAGVLGVGGLEIVDDHCALLPLAEGRRSFLMAMSPYMDEIFVEDKFPIDRRTLLSDEFTVASPDDYSAIQSYLHGRATFILGQIPDGPPFIEQEENVTFGTMLLDRARTVGRLAAGDWSPVSFNS